MWSAVRHGHYELGLDTELGRRLEVIFSELAVPFETGLHGRESVPLSPTQPRLTED